MSEGTKGPRLFDWACVPILYQWGNDGKHWLLIRRDQADPTRKTYYFVFAQPGATLQEMVKAIGKRWPVEEDFEITKDMGLGDYQVRSFLGWYRHITLVMFAYAFLVVICAKEPCENKMSNSPQHQASHPPIEKGGSSLKQASKDKYAASHTAASQLVPQPASLTVPEVRHLLARLIWPPPSSVTPALECRVVAQVPSWHGKLLPYQTSLASWIAPPSSLRSSIMLFSTRHPSWLSLFRLPGNSPGV